MLVDSHCDTLKQALKYNLSITDKRLKFNIQNAALPMIQVMAIYVTPEENGFEVAKRAIEKFEREKEKYKDKIKQIYSFNDIKTLRKECKIGIILSTENGSVISGNIDNIDYLYNKGIRMMSVVWNYRNELGTGALEKQDKGLTSLGIEFINKLNNKNIIIDISHASEKTFWDVIKYSKAPIVATHSCAYSVCNHPRNLKDDQIKKIAKVGGIIGIPFCGSFLKRSGKAEICDIIKHIQYIKELVGIDYVGIGSDFDGLDEEDIIENLSNINDINNLYLGLIKSGFTKNEINKIMGENWIGFFKKIRI